MEHEKILDQLTFGDFNREVNRLFIIADNEDKGKLANITYHVAQELRRLTKIQHRYKEDKA